MKTIQEEINQFRENQHLLVTYLARARDYIVDDDEYDHSSILIELNSLLYNFGFYS